MFNKKKRKNEKETLNIIHPTKKYRKIDYNEVFRNIRTNIEYSTVGKNIKVVNITSSIPEEAKSTTALNLAMIYAKKYKHVLLIDGDLRKAMHHHYLNLSNAKGLTNALMDYDETRRIDPKFFQQINDESFVGQLSVLTAGIKVPNPSELLSSHLFESFIADLRKIYDFIIIDCPPILSVSDAIPVGNVVDGTIFVCSSKKTNRKDAKTAIDILQKNHVNILGTVLTQVEQDNSNNYYYYY